MKDFWLAFCMAVVLLTAALAPVAEAQDQFIDCRKFADGIQITIDGDPSDWPLESFGNPAELPDIDPAEQFSDASTTNAIEQVPMTTGDHFVYDPDKLLIRATQTFETEGEGDFDATTYIGWNDEGFYLLNVVTDNKIGWFHGQSPNRDAENAPGFTNDGIEIWFDNDNDRMPPNINDDQTSEFDLQTAFNIDAPVIMEEFEMEPVMANGLPLDFAIFRSALNTDDEAEAEILAQIPRAVQLDDNPPEQHESYVQEIMFPWGVFPSFQPDEPIGFNINWIDWDDGDILGNDGFQLMRWSQGSESDLQYFREMRFTSDNPLGGPAGLPDWALF